MLLLLLLSLLRTADFTHADTGIVLCAGEGGSDFLAGGVDRRAGEAGSDLLPFAGVVAMPTGLLTTSLAGEEVQCLWYCGVANSGSELADVGVATFLCTIFSAKPVSLCSGLLFKPIS